MVRMGMSGILSIGLSSWTLYIADDEEAELQSVEQQRNIRIC